MAAKGELNSLNNIIIYCLRLLTVMFLSFYFTDYKQDGYRFSISIIALCKMFHVCGHASTFHITFL